MADSKLTDLTAIVSVDGDEVLYIVDDPATVPLDRKVTVTNLIASAKARANHTGTQTASTISDFNAAAVSAGSGTYVALTGDQTVAGVKTFSSSPLVPAPTTDLQAATKKYVDDNAGGGAGASFATHVVFGG